MKELDQMTPMEIVHLLFDELDKLNQRLVKIEEILLNEKSESSWDILTID